MSSTGNELEEMKRLLQQEDARGSLRKILECSDMLALMQCIDGVVRDPIGLFWHFYDPHYNYPKSGPISEIPEEWERVVLDSLERLYDIYRVRYEPDLESLEENDFQFSVDSGRPIIPDKLKDLITFLHVAAARGFRIKHYQGGGLDETSLDCLREVVRTLERIGSLDGREVGIIQVLEQDPSQSFLLSTYAVGAKALVEIGRMHQRQGHYEDALHNMARAALEASYAAERYAEEGEDFRFNSESQKLPQQPSFPLTDHLVGKGLNNISPQEIADVFLRLKEIGQAYSWSQVASDCKTLLESVYLFGAEDNSYTRFEGDESERITEWIPNSPDNIKNEEGWLLTWGEYWLTARAWASAQLSPSEYRKMREEDEKSASEDRLRSYFFGENWVALPDRAKDRLITADVIWNSKANIAWEAVLSDLRIATEDMCHHFLWEPLSGCKSGGKELLQFVQLKDELDRDEKRPEIGVCVEVCRAGYLKSFLEQQNLGRDDIEFLTKNLPSALSQLQEARNSGEHQSAGSWQRRAVGPYFHQLIGIGKRGILPELARIGRQLRRG